VEEITFEADGEGVKLVSSVYGACVKILDWSEGHCSDGATTCMGGLVECALRDVAVNNRLLDSYNGNENRNRPQCLRLVVGSSEWSFLERRLEWISSRS